MPNYGTLTITLYLCKGISNFVNALTFRAADTTSWHHRLQRMSENGIWILHSRNLLRGLKHVDLDLNENCVYGKQKRNLHLTTSLKSTIQSEQVHILHIIEIALSELRKARS